MTLKTPIFLENDTTTQNSDELRLERMYLTRSRSGVYTAGSFAVTQRGAGANMSVDVAAGGAVVLGTENVLQGSYHITNDATVNLVVAAADLTNPRKDAVILKVRDSFYTGPDDDAQLLIVAGTPAASPSEPDLDALGHENYMVLAIIDVDASASSIITDDITDRRLRVSAVSGDMVGTSAQRIALTGMTEGDTFYETDTNNYLRYDGTNWTLPKNAHGGELGYAEISTPKPSGIISGLVDVGGLSSAVTVLANRKVKVTVEVPAVFSTVAGDIMEIRIREGSTTLISGIATSSSGSSASPGRQVVWRGTPTAGAHTYKASVQRLVGTGSMSIETTAERRAFILVEDIGGV